MTLSQGSSPQLPERSTEGSTSASRPKRLLRHCATSPSNTKSNARQISTLIDPWRDCSLQHRPGLMLARKSWMVIPSYLVLTQKCSRFWMLCSAKFSIRADMSSSNSRNLSRSINTNWLSKEPETLTLLKSRNWNRTKAAPKTSNNGGNCSSKRLDNKTHSRRKN